MKVDFLCSSGSPVGTTAADIHGRGLGGAELALHTLAPILASRGHNIRMYNDAVGEYGGVQHLPVLTFDALEERDAVVLFRVPDPRFIVSTGRKIFWSCDQYTVGNYKTDVFPFADMVVTISPRHAAFFESNYQVQSLVVDLGVRIWEYQTDPPPEKIPNSLIFCSIPDRGLAVLLDMWPELKARVPDASLVITSDYTLWNPNGNPGTEHYRQRTRTLPDVVFKGKVPRSELVQLQLQAEIMAYPCVYDELFCISAAECQVAGAVPFTSSIGALDTTNRYGIKIHGHPTDGGWTGMFAGTIADFLTTKREELHTLRDMCYLSRREFDWHTLAIIWEGILSGNLEVEA